MRVVLDTNIFVSGIHWSGDSEKILRAWLLNKFWLVSSTEIIDEFVNTMVSLDIEEYKSIKILTPREFLELLKSFHSLSGKKV